MCDCQPPRLSLFCAYMAVAMALSPFAASAQNAREPALGPQTMGPTRSGDIPSFGSGAPATPGGANPFTMDGVSGPRGAPPPTAAILRQFQSALAGDVERQRSLAQLLGSGSLKLDLWQGTDLAGGIDIADLRSKANVQFEVDPAEGSRVVKERLRTPPPTWPGSRLDKAQEDAAIAALDERAELARQSACGDAIKAMRTPRLITGVGLSDSIRSFDTVCLSQRGLLGKLPLSDGETQAAASCLPYEKIVSQCFGATRLDEKGRMAVEALSGVISVRRVSATQRRRILCSASIIGRFHVLTARHCLGEFGSNGGFLHAAFHPHDASVGTAGIPITALRVAPDFGQRRELKADLDFAKLEQGAQHDDVLVLETQVALPAVALAGHVPAVSGQATAFAGFQRLVFDAMRLRSVIQTGAAPDDEAVLASGEWRQAMMLDATPTCRALALKQNETSESSSGTARLIGHMCQSLGRSSGAAMFAYQEAGTPSSPSRSLLGLTGIHIARAEAELCNNGPAEACQPRNLAVPIAEFGLPAKVATFEAARR